MVKPSRHRRYGEEEAAYGQDWATNDGPQAEKLGYLGLGLMGIPMTRRLLSAGHDVTVWNRSPGKAAGLVEAGASLAATPRDVAASAAIPSSCA